MDFITFMTWKMASQPERRLQREKMSFSSFCQDLLLLRLRSLIYVLSRMFCLDTIWMLLAPNSVIHIMRRLSIGTILVFLSSVGSMPISPMTVLGRRPVAVAGRTLAIIARAKQRLTLFFQ